MAGYPVPVPQMWIAPSTKAMSAVNTQLISMNTKHSKTVSKILLFFFWSVISTYTIPSNFAESNKASCSCSSGACACGRESSCRSKDGKSNKAQNNNPLIVSGNCQTARNGVPLIINFEVFPPATLCFIQNMNGLSKTFLKKDSKPATIFLEPPSKPPKFS